MDSFNWWVLGVLFLVAWFLQNAIHEMSHVVTGWTREGRKPLAVVLWPHRYMGYWYWARYRLGPATKPGSEKHRHIAPLKWAAYLTTLMLGLLLLSRSLYVVPFIVAPLVDMSVWMYGYVRRRPRTDGDRWRKSKHLRRNS